MMSDACICPCCGAEIPETMVQRTIGWRCPTCDPLPASEPDPRDAELVKLRAVRDRAVMLQTEEESIRWRLEARVAGLEAEVARQDEVLGVLRKALARVSRDTEGENACRECGGATPDMGGSHFDGCVVGHALALTAADARPEAAAPGTREEK